MSVLEVEKKNSKGTNVSLDIKKKNSDKRSKFFFQCQKKILTKGQKTL